MDGFPLPSPLTSARRVLVVGAGGGFDVYAGLPLYFALRRAGKEVALANLTFTYLGGTDARWLTRALAAVEPTTTGEDGYFPERCLARFLARRGEASTVYAIDKLGVRPVGEAYEYLAGEFGADALVLIDGGTDILMRGDEAGLGTPAEDMVSLGAASALGSVPTKLVQCVGFGVDTYHGVCHAHFLENVAALAAGGGFLGATSLLKEMPEARAYLEAVEAAERAMPERPSIVNGSIASAIEGRFGNVHRSERTRGSTLFISPLMSLAWTFDLASVAARSLYLSHLAGTESIWDVQTIIEAFRSGQPTRPRATIPH